MLRGTHGVADWVRAPPRFDRLGGRGSLSPRLFSHRDRNPTFRLSLGLFIGCAARAQKSPIAKSAKETPQRRRSRASRISKPHHHLKRLIFFSLLSLLLPGVEVGELLAQMLDLRRVVVEDVRLIRSEE